MISNERQYAATKAQASRFKAALSRLRESPPKALHPTLLTAEQDAIESQLDELLEEIQKFEELREGGRRQLELDDLSGLGELLIRARVASGLKQKDLASLLGLKEQQIQRYEDTRYHSAAWHRMGDVVTALGLTLAEPAKVNTSLVTLDSELKQLNEWGLPTSFVLRRLIPQRLIADGSSRIGALEVLLEAKRRIFSWPSASLDMAADRPSALAVEFKRPANYRKQTGYLAYARYLAGLTVAASALAKPRPVPATWSAFRKVVSAGLEELTLAATMQFVWDSGIPVLALDDPGGFHGACWEIEGRKVIVVKQRGRSEARWLFDLLHEVWHARRPIPSSEGIVEGPENSEEKWRSEEEQAASEFAGDVMLAGKSRHLATVCVDEAQNSVERLKSIVPVVAKREGVSVSALANYLAYRLARQGVNWWGAAQNLQREQADPLGVVRQIFNERVDFTLLDELDAGLLQEAIGEAV
ncbi:MAG: helix-turn-helix transcriptional regulator [Dehalococcoidia bacterium]